MSLNTRTLPFDVSGKDNYYQADYSTYKKSGFTLIQKTVDAAGTGSVSGYLLFRVTIGGTDVSNTSVYIDAVGAGCNPTPYGIASGTSQAAPVVAGAAAVIAYRNKDGELAGLSGSEYALKLRDLILASSTKYKNFEGLCSTGAQLDLTADTSVTPVISDIYFGESETELMIEGINFTDFGELTADRLDFDVVSWTDNKIVLMLYDVPAFLQYRFELTNSYGESFAKYFTVDSILQPVYEFNIPFDGTTTDYYDSLLYGFSLGFSNMMDVTSNVSFLNLNNRMYLKAPDRLYVCDGENASLTEVMFQKDDCLFGCCSTGSELYFILEKAYSNEYYLVRYDASGTMTRKLLNMGPNVKFIRDGFMLYFNGLLYYFGETDNPVVYDVPTIKIDPVKLTTESLNNKIIVPDDSKANSSTLPLTFKDGFQYRTGVFRTESGGRRQALLKFSASDNGGFKYEDVSYIVPAGKTTDKSQIYYAAVQTDDSLIIAGLRSDNTTDTWVFKDGELKAYPRSASLGDLYLQSAGYSNGYLYVIGRSGEEPEGVILRATNILANMPNPDPPFDPPQPIPDYYDYGDSDSSEGYAERIIDYNGADSYLPGYGVIGIGDGSTGFVDMSYVGMNYVGVGTNVFPVGPGYDLLGMPGGSQAGSGSGNGDGSGSDGNQVTGGIRYIGSMPYIYYDPAGSWVKDSVGWMYSLTTGASHTEDYIKNAWAYVGGKWYHFDERGYMQTGFIKDEVQGAAAAKWYYMTADGSMAKGLIEPSDGYLYYMSPVNGVMQTGRLTIDGTERHFRSDFPSAPTYTRDPASGIYIRNSVDDIPYGAAIKR
ncbi:MAG: hypothetical protein Q4E57_03215 [Eubacteriales bacterium]|nr:hypothetical protein [Eubacteriales bacterium]